MKLYLCADSRVRNYCWELGGVILFYSIYSVAAVIVVVYIVDNRSSAKCNGRIREYQKYGRHSLSFEIRVFGDRPCDGGWLVMYILLYSLRMTYDLRLAY